MRKPLEEPRKGWGLWIWKLFIHQLIHGLEVEKYNIRKSYIFSIYIAEKAGKNVLVFIIGPGKLTVGIGE